MNSIALSVLFHDVYKEFAHYTTSVQECVEEKLQVHYMLSGY